MRAGVLTAYEHEIAIEELEPVPLGPHEVRVRIEASGICHSDLTMVRGGLKLDGLPVILGHEGAGRVLEIGSGVTRVRPGDRVIAFAPPVCGSCDACLQGRIRSCSLGASVSAAAKGRRADGSAVPGLAGLGLWADELPLHEACLVSVDTAVPFEQLALIACGVATGVGAAVNTAKVEPGATVAVFGCGGVGQSVIQGARICGASRIIAIDPVSAKRDIAVRSGATDAIDPEEIDTVGAVLSATRGQGVDYAFEAVGLPSTIMQAYTVARFMGTVVVVGMAREEATLSLSPQKLMLEGKRLLGSFMGHTHPPRDYPRLVSLVESGRLDVGAMVSRTVALDDVSAALRAMETGDEIRNIIV